MLTLPNGRAMAPQIWTEVKCRDLTSAEGTRPTWDGDRNGVVRLTSSGFTIQHYHRQTYKVYSLAKCKLFVFEDFSNYKQKAEILFQPFYITVLHKKKFSGHNKYAIFLGIIISCVFF